MIALCNIVDRDRTESDSCSGLDGLLRRYLLLVSRVPTL